MTYERHFPLHVLVISNRYHDDDNHGLAKCLREDPAVRSMGFTTSREEGRRILDKDEVNTIMLDPSSGPDNPAPFIDEIRRDFPRIVFVIFARASIWEYFLKDEPRFEHYFHLDSFDVIHPYTETPSGPESACYQILRRCEQWHKERFEYDVALSFAGNNRPQAESLATALRDAGVQVFYDDFEQSTLLGRDLYTFLYEVYSRRCRYCAILISEDYVRRMWTIHERAAAQERALKERGNAYILPIRLDDAQVPGLSGNIAYVSFSVGINTIVNLIVDKLWVRDPSARKRHFGSDIF